jgi:uncharacterized protein YgiM (DUF1202 family)
MLKAKTYIVLICLCGSLTFVFAQTDQTFPFLGRVKAKDINVRADATVSSSVICQAQEGERLEVVAEFYEWYKVRLPKYAPAYINKAMVELVDARTAKVAKDRVNIRLLPSETSPVIGNAARGEAINILEFRRDWYKIQPVQNSFGWINKKFVEKSLQQEIPALSSEQPQPEQKIIPERSTPEEAIVLEGILKPYGRVFRRQATHKIIDSNKKVYLLKGNTAILNSLSRLKVKVTGRIISPHSAKYPLIEVDKIEVLN